MDEIDIDSSVTEFQLLRRPKSLPDFSELEPGLYAWWPCKYFVYKHRSDFLPRANFNVTVQIKYSNLVIRGFLPKQNLIIPLVSIGYVESIEHRKALDARGVSFRLVMFGVKNLEETRDRLRFLVLRQRIPHSILKIPFDWQKTDDDSVDAGSANRRLRSLCCFCVKNNEE